MRYNFGILLKETEEERKLNEEMVILNDKRTIHAEEKDAEKGNEEKSTAIVLLRTSKEISDALNLQGILTVTVFLKSYII